MEQELYDTFEKPVILFDDQSTKIGYFMGLGAAAEADQVNFMIKHGRGLVYVCITEEKARKLSLPFITMSHSCRSDHLMAVSVDYKTNSTGISAADRADTIRAFVDDDNTKDDFRKPGHMFPIIIRHSDSRQCDNVPEAALNLANFVSKHPVAFICEILNEHGDLASIHEIEQFSRIHQIKMFSLSDVNEMIQRHHAMEVGFDSMNKINVHSPDLDFVHGCEEHFGINRGVYNVIDSWFFEQGIFDIIIRRNCIIQFLSYQMQDVKQGSTLKFGNGGLTARLKDFWCKMQLEDAKNKGVAL